MQQPNPPTPEQVRQMIFNRARQMSRQIAAAAQEIGERAAEQRHRLEEQNMPASHTFDQGLTSGNILN